MPDDALERTWYKKSVNPENSPARKIARLFDSALRWFPVLCEWIRAELVYTFIFQKRSTAFHTPKKSPRNTNNAKRQRPAHLAVAAARWMMRKKNRRAAIPMPHNQQQQQQG
jgi:hypothetical protein